MKGAALVGVLVAVMSFATLMLIESWVAALPVVLAGASITLTIYALVRTWHAEARVARMAALAVAAYEGGHRTLPLQHIAWTLNDPTVLSAATAAKQREAAALAMRYANGDASDY